MPTQLILNGKHNRGTHILHWYGDGQCIGGGIGLVNELTQKILTLGAESVAVSIISQRQAYIMVDYSLPMSHVVKIKVECSESVLTAIILSL